MLYCDKIVCKKAHKYSKTYPELCHPIVFVRDFWLNSTMANIITDGSLSYLIAKA